MNSDKWMHGLCSNFAVALKNRFGGKIFAVVNHSKKYPNDDLLWHCYCVIDGVAWDADGPHDLENASDITIYEMPKIDLYNECSFIWKEVDEVWLNNVHEDYNPNYFPDANKFITFHQNRFKTLINMMY